MARPSIRLVSTAGLGRSLTTSLRHRLDGIDNNDGSVGPTFIQDFFAGDDDPLELIFPHHDVVGRSVEVIDGPIILEIAQDEISGRLDAGAAFDDAFACHDAFGRRFIGRGWCRSDGLSGWRSRWR